MPAGAACDGADWVLAILLVRHGVDHVRELSQHGDDGGNHAAHSSHAIGSVKQFGQHGTDQAADAFGPMNGSCRRRKARITAEPTATSTASPNNRPPSSS